MTRTIKVKGRPTKKNDKGIKIVGKPTKRTSKIRRIKKGKLA